MASSDDQLLEYNRKRDFSKTAEPEGKANDTAPDKLLFAVQKHAATRLHYDLRLEWGGVLKSWAVTRGPSVSPDDKRLAVRTEDHPFDYGDFEGTIPKKEYGGGTVMLWDTGWWEPVDDPDKTLPDGKLHFIAHGERMHGEWILVRMKPRSGEKRENWLLMKARDEAAEDDGERLVRDELTSVKTGRTMEDIAAGSPPAKASPKAKGAKKSPAKASVAKTPARTQPQTKAKAPARGSAPAFQPPQLATLVSKAPDGEEWLNEVKFDGYRLLVALGKDGATCYTRTGLDWTAKFPDIADAMDEVECQSALMDGEAVAHGGGSQFSALQKALKDGGPIEFYAFDLLELNGKSLKAQTLLERKETLQTLLAALPADSPIKYSDHVVGHGPEVFSQMCGHGQEGIIAKRADAAYENRRSGSWLKIKCTKRQEFVIGGYSKSDKAGRPFASLLIGTFQDGKLTYQGRVGTGFDHDTMADLAARFKPLTQKTMPFVTVPRPIKRDAVWIDPVLIAEVDYAEFTDDGQVRHGAFLGLRDDKEADAVTLETPEPAPDTETQKPAAKKSAPRRGTKPEDVLGISITHPERMLFSDPEITKVDLARYYAVAAPKMLAFAANHPLSLVRCPDGPQKKCFYQKHASDGFPEAIRQVPIAESNGDVENYLYVRDAEGLVASVQMSTTEFHIWGSTIDNLDKPDRMIFDLDPDPSVTFETVKTAAVELRDMLADIGLKSVPMVTGGKGVHVIVPLSRRADWDMVKPFTKAVAQHLAQERPKDFIATMSKAKRKGRIFVDWLRNDRGSTAIAPYSVRARDGGPVATPVSWEELADLKAANLFRIPDVLARLDQPDTPSSDPWGDAASWKQSLTQKMIKSL